MTEQEKLIIQSIKEMGFDRTAYRRDLVSAVISKAIKALEQTELVDGDRAISLNAAIEAVRELSEWHTGDAFNADRVINHLIQLPPVTPQRPTGHWIEGKYRDDDIRYNDSSYKCDKCGRIVDFKENSCPDCGCRMIEPQESEKSEDYYRGAQEEY